MEIHAFQTQFLIVSLPTHPYSHHCNSGSGGGVSRQNNVLHSLKLHSKNLNQRTSHWNRLPSQAFATSQTKLGTWSHHLFIGLHSGWCCVAAGLPPTTTPFHFFPPFLIQINLTGCCRWTAEVWRIMYENRGKQLCSSHLSLTLNLIGGTKAFSALLNVHKRELKLYKMVMSMLYSSLSTVYSRLQVCEATEILAHQTCATRIKGTCTVIIKVNEGRIGWEKHERSALECRDAVLVWTVWVRTYFRVRVRWNPNKAKSNSIHWLWQRVEPSKSFRNYSADCIVSQFRGWERLLVLHTVTARSTSLLCTTT